MFVINFSLPSINSIILNRAFVSAQFSSPPLAILQNIFYRHCDEKQKRNGRIDDWKKKKKKRAKEKRREYTGHWTLEGGSFPARRLSRCSWKRYVTHTRAVSWRGSVADNAKLRYDDVRTRWLPVFGVSRTNGRASCRHPASAARRCRRKRGTTTKKTKKTTTTTTRRKK